MERKLLSLPSFFVLLLIAGIAFLAAPVEDVDAALDNTPTVARQGSGNVNRGDSVVFRITFNPAVKVAGETTSGQPDAWDTEEGFGVEDLDVTITTSGGDNSTTRRPTAAEFEKADATDTAGSGARFDVTIAAPLDDQGTIGVSLKGFDTGNVEFEQTDGSAYAATSPVVGTAVSYDTRDQVKPTAAFAAPEGLGLTGTSSPFTAIGAAAIEGVDNNPADQFQIEITVTDNVGLATSGDGAFVPDADVKLTTTLYPAPATAPTTDPSTFTSWVKGTATATSVTHVLVINPADGATAVKVELKKDSVTDAATPPNKLNVAAPAAVATVNISARPKVAITFSAPTSPATTHESGDITVTFGISVNPGTGALALEKDEITVTNGALKADSLERQIAMPPAGGSVAFYTAMITPTYTATPVVVTVEEDAVQASATAPGNAEKSSEIPVVVPPEPGTTEPTPEPTGTTGTLVGNRLTFALGAITPTSRFVVIARDKANSATNGISAGTVVNINDEAWKDLQDFLAYNGGTIDLSGPDGTVKHDLVISEVMWGNDAGLDEPTESQWIELYNTRSTKTGETRSSTIPAGDWTLEFRASDDAPDVANVANFSDRFSNKTLGGGNWNIPNQDGGKYGQSGRTVSRAPNIGTLRELVSMRRDINYTTVEKNDHKTATGENRTEQLKGVPDGALAGSWKASTSRINMSGTRKGTPGAKHLSTVTTTSISKSVVFNEIANRSEDKNDWIELYNDGSSDVEINNWVITKVTKVGTDGDVVLFKFESDENIVVPSKGFLLVVNEDPSETSLSAGENVDNPGSKQNGLPTKFYLNDKLKIPEKDYLLILRTEDKKGTDEKIVDIAGNIGAMNLSNTPFRTKVWPLKAWNAIKTDDLTQNNDKTWVRDKGKNLDHADAWKPDGGVTGLGVDRNATSRHSGTPGFDNGAVKGKVKDLADKSNPVVISEIMFGTGDGRVPQWIELYNPSMTQAVNLDGWRLEVQNVSDASEDLNVKLNYELRLPAKRILPNQTLLIVSASGDTNDDKRFPSDRIINVWSTRNLRTAAEMSGRRDALLSSIGFYLTLSDPDKVMVDEIGNIEGNKRNNKPPAWALKGGNLEEGGRSSMVRVSGSEGDGTEPDAWRSAENTIGGEVGVQQLYYGDEDDYGTPGYTPGGPLPVQLSSFYSKRNDAGAVVITWSTESELDNAGFNILRSMSRTGEFTRINAQLIPGAGTTGEKNTYTWTDTSARPNVVYYYQIEDVSLEGEHRTLRTTRLRGHVGAAGKATVIWGELKSRK